MRLSWIVSCLLNLSAAHQSDSPSQQIRLDKPALQSQKNTISTSLFAELEELSRIIDISYCVGSVGLGIQKPFTCPSRCAEFENFELVTTWNTGVLLSDSCGYIALSHAPAPKRLIVAFRGTYSLSNTIADLSTMPQEYSPYPGTNGTGDVDEPMCTNCTVHTGFYTSWANSRDVILPEVQSALAQYPDYAVTLVGHSLGGAVAAFAGLELLARGYNPTVTTFGEPRIGNKAMAAYLDERFNLTSNTTASLPAEKLGCRRVTHAADPIPFLPLQEWGYMPHSGEIYIAKPELPPSVADIRHCVGAEDPECATGPPVDEKHKHFWAIPARFRLWELFFAHRDYFWRLGLCLPTIFEGEMPGLVTSKATEQMNLGL